MGGLLPADGFFNEMWEWVGVRDWWGRGEGTVLHVQSVCERNFYHAKANVKTVLCRRWQVFEGVYPGRDSCTLVYD